MNIVVLNGSPKGDFSVTLQTVLYIAQKFPKQNFEIINVGQKIKALELDCSKAIESLKNADMILFSYPVYTFLAPYQLHRFIEMIKENGVDLSGKFAAQLSTSKHFYDVTAHKYIEENCGDLGLNYISGLSADMDDLLTEKGQNQAISFWNYVEFCVKENIFKKPIKEVNIETSYTAIHQNKAKKDGKKTIILTNSKNDPVLDAMIADFQNVYQYDSRIINVADFPFTGGCLSCFRCAANGDCIYKDGFPELLRGEILKADSLVYAFTIKDHSMGASFKIYDDRQFCNGHRQLTIGMPVGYIINGSLKNEANVKALVEARNEVAHTFLSGIVTSDNADYLENMAKSMEYALENKILLPQNFYGIGGMKIFRDLIYVMKGIMRADHKYYKKIGVYDFPQKNVGKNIKMYLLGRVVSMPAVQKKMGNKMNEGMIAPYKKILEQNADTSINK